MTGTDSTKVMVPFGSFILTEQATNEFPWATELASRYSARPSEVAGGQNAILTNGETYFPPEAVEDIGVGTLRQMNNKPKEGGHAAIDKILAMTTLQGLKPMNTGGEVMPNYSGGGLTGYQDGGGTTFEDAIIAARTPFHNLKPNLDTGMYDIESIAGIAGDGGRDYYMGKGSAESPSAAAQAAHLIALKNSMSGESMDIDPSDVGSYFKPKKKGLMGLLGFQQGDLIGYQGGDKVSGLSKLLSMITPKGRRQGSYEEMVPQDMMPIVSNRQIPDDFFASTADEGGYRDLEKEEERSALLRMLQGRPPAPQDWSDAQLDLHGYQNGDMIGPPVPPQMMGEQGNRELSDSIDMRQANPQMGGELGVIRQESEAIEAKIKDNIARNARLALEKIELDNVLKTDIPDSLITDPRYLNFRDPRAMNDNSVADLMRTRDLDEYLKMQVMQRGVGSVREGMGDDPWRAIR